MFYNKQLQLRETSFKNILKYHIMLLNEQSVMNPKMYCSVKFGCRPCINFFWYDLHKHK